jgi:enoyl-CoA hydratase/carnithine racemase
MGEAVRYEVRNHTAWITLNRPEKLNSINKAMRVELNQALTDVRENRDVWVAIITGEGRAFCTGKDLLESIEDQKAKPTNDDNYLLQSEITKPIIAAINGPCLAQGGGLVLLSDIRIMSDRAYLGWPQVKRGISSVSGPTLLAHRIPLNYALQYLFTGRFIQPQEALELRLVNAVVPHDELLDAAQRCAEEILENAPLAVQAIKEATLRGYAEPLAERIKIARSVADRLLQTEDAKEGIRAFAEKRKPVWQAR